MYTAMNTQSNTHAAGMFNTARFSSCASAAMSRIITMGTAAAVSIFVILSILLCVVNSAVSVVLVATVVVCVVMHRIMMVGVILNKMNSFCTAARP